MSKQKKAEKNKPEYEPFPDYELICSKLSNITEVGQLNIHLAYAFSVAFVHILTSDLRNSASYLGTYTASRSNWTYHVAGAISQACKMLDLSCRFEALGKRDAIIETRDEEPVTVLAAEWEWDYADVFGKGKELDKLIETCREYKDAEAFLLTFCPLMSYPDYLQNICSAWLTATKSMKSPPPLFFHAVIFEDVGRVRDFLKIKTVEIDSNHVTVWNDHYL